MVSAPCRVAPLTLQVAIALVSVTACTGDDFHPTASPASGAGGQAPAGAGGGEEAGSAGTSPVGGGGDSSGSAAATGGDGGTGPVGGGGDAGTSSAGQAGAAGGGSGGAGAAGAGAGGACEGSVATTICGGVCVDTTEDRLHCGACDVVCGASEDCVQGACGPSCASQLNEPIVDAWGFAWDGVDRAGSNFPSARGTCASLGGRLPTATEILRVSAARTKQVGKSTDTSALWTSVPASPQEQFTARLSGAGDPDKAATTMARPSRCVCPPPRTKGYGGHDCNGAAGPGCATFVRDGRQLAIDAFDRARLPLGAAEWECQSLGGALPPPAVYADLASTASGLGAGNGELHHTSDQAVTDAQVEARWGAEGTWSVGSGGFAYSAYLTAHTFRCMGPAQASPKSAAAPSNALVVPNTHVAFDAVDNAPPAPFLDAVAACFARGGHLPSSLTLFDAILAGASSGAKKPLWTADFVDPIGGTAAVGTIGWFDSAPRAALVAGVNEGVARQSVTDTNRASRCVFYPRDTAYAGPPPATCQGGCASISPAGMAAPGEGPRLWIDEEDRAAVAWTAANHQCQSLGGSLPSTRDLIEIAGAAYENASDAFLWTADLAGYLPQVITFSLSPTMPPFASGLTKQVALAKIGEARAYRCVFTDEAR